MLNVFRSVGLAAALATAASLAPMGIANAQSPAVSVAVPSPGGGGGNAAGCYRVAHQIYGPYRLGFCLRGRGGTYQVTGGGLNCNGRLDWYQNGNRVDIDLYRAPCGRGTDWTGDSLSCRLQGGGRPPLLGGGVSVAVPAPSIPMPGAGSLGCTYKPAAGGYRPISVTANRV